MTPAVLHARARNPMPTSSSTVASKAMTATSSGTTHAWCGLAFTGSLSAGAVPARPGGANTDVGWPSSSMSNRGLASSQSSRVWKWLMFCR